MCINGSYLVQKGSVDVGGCGEICSQVGLDVAELLVMSEGFFLQRSRTVGQLEDFESLTSSCATTVEAEGLCCVAG